MKFLPHSELSTNVAHWCDQLSVNPASAQPLAAPALLVLDMQNEFLHENGRLPVWGGPAIIEGVARLVRAFRAAGRPVLFTRHVCLQPRAKRGLGMAAKISDPDNLLREGKPETEIIADLTPQDGEYVLTKHRYSGFYGTPLETVLRHYDVKDVVISGVATNICCEATAHDAFFRGFGVVFTIDGTGGFDEPSHLATLKTIKLAYGRLATVQQIHDALLTLESP